MKQPETEIKEELTPIQQKMKELQDVIDIDRAAALNELRRVNHAQHEHDAVIRMIYTSDPALVSKITFTELGIPAAE